MSAELGKSPEQEAHGRLKTETRQHLESAKTAAEAADEAQRLAEQLRSGQ